MKKTKTSKGSLPLKWVAVLVLMLLGLVVAFWLITRVKGGAGEGLDIIGSIADKFTP